MNRKKIVFESTDVSHAALILRLRQVKVSQRSFFEFFLNAFVTERGCLDAFTEKLIEECSPVGKKSAALLQKTKSRGNKDLDSLNLSEREREEIFDILELENFD